MLLRFLLLSRGKYMKYFFQYAALIFLRTVLNIFNLFPIKNNRLMFYSFNGKQYSCNPRCITEELLKRDKNSSLEICWAFKDPKKFEGIVPDRIKSVKYRSLKYYYLAKTSKIVIINVSGYGEVARRKKQIFIQTWHAGNGYKRAGEYQGLHRKVYTLGHRDNSYVISGSESMTKRRVRHSMGFEGTVIKGTPRMDMLIRQDNPQAEGNVRNALSIADNKKIVMYAPTWRRNRTSEAYHLDYEKLVNILSEKFGGEWIVMVRMHPNIRNRPLLDKNIAVDASDYPDMRELLYTSDVLISDYSSCIWDYSFLYRPCFLYCYDLDEYYKKENFDVPIEDWNFPICKNFEELAKEIKLYDENKFKEKMTEHHKAMGSYEDGNSTGRVCDLIEQLLKTESEG